MWINHRTKALTQSQDGASIHSEKLESSFCVSPLFFSLFLPLSPPLLPAADGEGSEKSEE